MPETFLQIGIKIGGPISSLYERILVQNTCSYDRTPFFCGGVDTLEGIDTLGAPPYDEKQLF